MAVGEPALEVPVIDIGALIALEDDASVGDQLHEENPVLREVIEQVRAASTEWGFFYIKNHGVTEQQLERFRGAFKGFFDLPKASKLKIRSSAANPRGWDNEQLTKNKLDWKEIYDVGGPQEDVAAPGGRHNQWPDEDELPGFRATLVEYYKHLTHVSRRLIQVIAVALGERFDFFDQYFREGTEGDDHSSRLRLNHYPVAPEPEKTMGLYHHTDSGAVTVLLQDDDVASLQVFHRESQSWVGVPPIKDTYVINIGDMVQIWSNDKFVAPLHRVLASGTSVRYSSPFFYTPSFSADVEPIVTGDEKPQYRAVNWREFRDRRIAGNLADLGVEVQISDYRID